MSNWVIGHKKGITEKDWLYPKGKFPKWFILLIMAYGVFVLTYYPIKLINSWNWATFISGVTNFGLLIFNVVMVIKILKRERKELKEDILNNLKDAEETN